MPVIRIAAALLCLWLLSGAGWGQIAISTRAGMILYTEGAVFLDGEPFTLPTAEFVYVKEAGSLDTDDGRAEILLSNTSFLRLGKHSRVEMLAAEVADARVRLRRGSAIVDVWFLDRRSTVTVRCGEVGVSLLRKGRYRFDIPAEGPATLKVFHGRATVSTKGGECLARRGQLVTLNGGDAAPAAVRFNYTRLDALDRWNAKRQLRVERRTRAAARSQFWLKQVVSDAWGPP